VLAQHFEPGEAGAGRAEPVLSALRAATAERHSAIDRLLNVDRFVDRDRYLSILGAFDGFLDRWEPRVLALMPPAFAAWFRAGSRRSLLKRDMAELHASPFALAAEFADRPCLDSRAAAFGSMYVLEGSALGGRVIAKRVEETLAIHAGNGGAYFAGLGKDTGLRWREFRAALEIHVGPAPGSLQLACMAAVETFDALTETFARALDVNPA
jgi:heme oxygenase